MKMKDRKKPRTADATNSLEFVSCFLLQVCFVCLLFPITFGGFLGICS